MNSLEIQLGSSGMFPSQNNELVYGEPLLFEHDKILEDLLADCAPLSSNHLTTEKGTTDTNDKGTARKRALKSTTEENKEVEEDHNDLKKTMHREIEKQRRQEMAGLYASLRTLLPLKYIKGKRSISDHMYQAVNYIKHMQKNIEEMQVKRDRFKKLYSSPSSNIVSDQDTNSNTGSSVISVEVSPCIDGVEILISNSLNEECFRFSKVLMDLTGRGHNVISCVSTRATDRFLHKIQIEVNDLTRVDLFELQERLSNVIKHGKI